MTDKPRGARPAAKEIINYVIEQSKDGKYYLSEKTVENIIVRHCAEDKAGKLVKAAKCVTFLAQIGRYPTIKDTEAWRNAMVKLEAALAEYEEATK